MEHSKQPFLKRLLSVRGMGAALTAFAGLIIIYIAFGLINPTVFSGRNIVNLTRSMSKYLIIGIGQSYLLITGNIDLSIGSVIGMSAMISGTLMSGGMHPIPAILVTLVACLLVGVLNGMLVGKFQLPPFIATLGTMFVARGVAYMVNGNRNTNAIASGIGQEMGDRFQNFFYYGDTLGLYNTFWIAMILFAAFFFLLSKTRTGRAHLCHRLQRGRGQAVWRVCGGHGDQGVSGGGVLLVRGGPDPVRAGQHGQHGGRQHL